MQKLVLYQRSQSLLNVEIGMMQYQMSYLPIICENYKKIKVNNTQASTVVLGIYTDKPTNTGGTQYRLNTSWIQYGTPQTLDCSNYNILYAFGFLASSPTKNPTSGTDTSSTSLSITFTE